MEDIYLMNQKALRWSRHSLEDKLAQYNWERTEIKLELSALGEMIEFIYMYGHGYKAVYYIRTPRRIYHVVLKSPDLVSVFVVTVYTLDNRYEYDGKTRTGKHP